jgi:hypothetical protein
MSETTPRGLLLALMEPDQSREEEFNDWYDFEHIPQMSALPGIIGASRWVCVDGWPRYLAIYDLDSIEVLSSEAYRRATGGNFTPWARRILGAVRGWRRVALTGLEPGAPTTGDAAGAIDVMFTAEGAGGAGFAARVGETSTVLQARAFNVPDEVQDLVLVEAGAVADLPPLRADAGRPPLRWSARYVRYGRRDPLHAFHAIDAGEAH